MNSNPILNREIIIPWHGEAQVAEGNKLGKSNVRPAFPAEYSQSWYTQVTVDFLTLLDTEQIQYHVTKIQQEYIVCDTIASKIQRRRRQKEIANILFFTQICFQFSCGFAGTI